jgi:DNA (cytosine-5)-methyltransferase 1
MKYIDLFAGAGGLSEGFLRAGFEAVAHIEMNPDAVKTIKTRLAYWYLHGNNRLDEYYNYLRGEITSEELYTLIPEEILSTVLNYTMSEENINEIFDVLDESLQHHPDNNHIHLIVGGPPCQAYSLAGRARMKNRDPDAQENDHRKYLYRIYCQFLQHYLPDMFVFENVPGLLSADNGRHWREIQEMLRNAGFTIETKELNAKDFGVPQERKRIIVIGWRQGTPHHYPEFQEVEPSWNIEDILVDLPAIQAGEQSKKYRKKKPHPYVSDNLRTENDVLTWHIARPNIDRDREIYRLAIHEWIDGEKHRRLHYQDIPENLRTHKNIADFADRFKIVAPDIPYCHTMLAHISKDGHYFIHPDIEQSRSITVREAARIQSFPDSYFFEGSRTSAFTQIGNAVPPLMAQRIAEALILQFQEE